jgi:chitodextrinase
LLVVAGFGVGCSDSPSQSETLVSNKAAVNSVTTIGETTVLSGTDSGNGNLLIVQDVSLSQPATIQSLSFYVRKASGSLVLGIYDNTGPSNGPGTLKAQTSSFATVAGWDTVSVVTPVALAAGNYWLAYLPSSSSLAFASKQTGVFKYANVNFGSMPTKFPAVAGQGSTHWSIYATLNLSTDTTLPTVPTNLIATSVSTQVTLSWTASTDNVGVAGYSIYRNSAKIAAITSGTSYTDAGLAPNTTYSYTVSAYDAAGNNSAQTSPVNATTFADTIAPSVPTGLAATPVSNTQINLTWTASSDNLGVTSYNVLRNGVQVATPTGNSYSDIGLAPNSTYSYTVSARDAAGNVSVQSGSVQAETLNMSAATPALIQHVASSANPLGLGLPGNNFKIPLPNSVGAGNCLVLGITYPHGSMPTITDNNGNIWPAAAAVAADAGNGNYVAAIWVLPNAHAGQTLITVSFSAVVIPFEYTLSEFDNIATVSPVNGIAASTNKTGASLSTGPLTPGNNDSNGGNLIWNYYALSSIANGNPTKWAASNGFTLLDADIAWTKGQGFPHASQFYVQTAASPISPGVAATGDTSNRYNAVAVALRVARGGNAAPSSIHVNKILHQTSNAPPSGTWVLQFPATGNLRVVATANGNNLTNITGITDSDNGVWTKIEPADDEPQIWYSANASINANLVVTLHLGAGPTMTLLFYDIANAATAPLDTYSGAPAIAVSNQTIITNMPSITPTTANGLVIAVMGDGDGPVLGLNTGSPSGAIFDLVNYSEELDVDLMENADGQAHYYNSDMSVENWNWRITSNPNNTVFATAAAFKSR